ncbi:nicotinate phosphoribosyltransferase [Spiroplasma taiwanense]|uniref:nicotinate phosphoribosyltransferase n=1 Tax=Spiroplasma taiwanense CT-1 TaxID=1276220 RepID=S5LUT5_9MOLU|nr:nicotinate phosphoribosyltransferase [Spiroplasma taiwanense]AGR41564.1 nicotinate phosphoribosyltransferase [Spiroplasma taiwanense CT-1]
MRNNIKKWRFNIDQRVFEDYYSADYFKKTKEILLKFKKDQIITMQWFQRKENIVLCGIEIIKEILSLSNNKNLMVQGLNDGDIVNSLEPVLKITGKYQEFAHFEGLFDGILSRASTIATNCSKIKSVANNKIVLNMNDRMDYFLNQQIDGYASYVGGIKNFVTSASFEFLDEKPVLNGTMPHSLIASFNGDLIAATEAYNKVFPNNNLVVLVDYNNDCIKDALAVCSEFKDKIWAIRLDTSQGLVDKSLMNLKEISDELHGVNPTLIKLLREKLDVNGFEKVKIIVSSGFDEKKIAWFEKENTPVDIYGVGEAITKNKISFTGDIVLINGEKQSKFGRENINSKRIKSIKY